MTLAVRHYFASVGSTQTLAADLARRGAPTGTLVVSRTQTDGVGRADHAWSSPPGGLYLSTLVEPAPNAGSLLPLSLGVALSEEFEREWGVQTLVKWPNDLLHVPRNGQPRKLGGILVDRVARPDSGRVDVVGVGINVHSEPVAFPSELRAHVVALQELAGREVDLEAVERAVVTGVRTARERVETPDGRASTVRALGQRLYGQDATVTVEGGPTGSLVGVASDGAAEVAVGDVVLQVRAGTLTFPEPT